jgi:two-component system, NtrC family, sensor kinase
MSNNMDFTSNQLSKNLAERVKELECLYNISRIARAKKNDELNPVLEKILEEIPNGWQFPEQMATCLMYGAEQLGEKPIDNNYQSVKLQITEGIDGELFIYFKKNAVEIDNRYFLREEQALLNQIGHEVASLIELSIKRKKELIIQDKLRANDRLNLLGELTAGIAHELNTPLGNIMGYSELLLKDEKNSQKKNDLEKVIKSAKHAREIVKKLMIFSCEMPSQFKTTDLNQLIKECVDLIKIQLGEKKISVKFSLQEDFPKLKLDPVQFTQVIFNILLNAIDAMDKNGSISISTRAIKNDIRIKITDNGKGIPEDQLQYLFHPFYSNKSQSGTGLGLAVTHGIIQAHGGSIQVESRVDEGTTFTIILKS